MYVRLYNIEDERFIATSFFDGRLVWANYSRQELVTDIHLPQDCYGAFAVSDDGRRLVTGYWGHHGIDIWELPDGERLDHFAGSQTSWLFLDPSGRYVAIDGRPRKCVRDLQTRTDLPIRRLGDLRGACFDYARQSLWLPIERKGSLVRVTRDPLEAQEVDSRINGKIWTMRYSPSCDRAVLFVCHHVGVDTSRDSGHVVCLTEIEGDYFWDHPLTGSDVSSNGAFSGDGSLVGVHAVDAGCVIVLDAKSGREVGRIPERFHPDYPLDDTTVMASDGRILDLQSGRVYDAVNKPAWWRAAGLKFG